MNKIDLIIDALIAFDVMAHEQKIPVYIDEAHKALAAARSLRELKPVAWMSQGGDASRSANYFKEMGFTNLIELYALDEVKHD